VKLCIECIGEIQRFIVHITVYRVAQLLDAKGGGKKGRFQGKATKIEGRREVEELLKKECTET